MKIFVLVVSRPQGTDFQCALCPFDWLSQDAELFVLHDSCLHKEERAEKLRGRRISSAHKTAADFMCDKANFNSPAMQSNSIWK